MKKPSTMHLALLAAVASWAVSLYLHHPNVANNIYSDVASFWWREEHLKEGKIPCIQYFFEYPPAACFIVYAARLVGGAPLQDYYMAFAALSLPAYLALAWALTRLSGSAGVFFILMPSMVVYGIYNFDHFFTACLAVSLVLFMEGRARAAYFLLGVGFSVKLFTALLLPVYLLERGRRGRDVFEGLGFFAAGALPATAPVLAANPTWVGEFLNYHTTWGLENAWTVWLSADPFSQSAKVLGYLVAAILLLRSYLSQTSTTVKGFLVFSAWLLGSPTFTPQMAIWLIPFTACNPRLWLLVPLFEAANAGIIFTWFTTDIPTHPWTLPQTMSLLRAAALAGMWLTTYRSQPQVGEVSIARGWGERL
ncbi:MAG: glycosyltransferase 87 family protein [Candidatus Caldarchaeum sp.]|nr:glycosyltransferase 87 family protein [Candidatus Caldarchaeum sp.]MCS7137657.1 glycosyltransferase 87 family protein [Candidatus Caldarchaeum sp.]MDW7977402.1 glycosyltransferase 87 family protein [Candidatus Caldarchaeum sp.]MDW8358975.1 glycosyltransferase 87 family protein [Candidatus Caldarchaeum sp.]